MTPLGNCARYAVSFASQAISRPRTLRFFADASKILPCRAVYSFNAVELRRRSCAGYGEVYSESEPADVDGRASDIFRFDIGGSARTTRAVRTERPHTACR